MRKSKFLLFTFYLLLFVGCTVDLPSYVIHQGKMERILYDYHLAQGMAEAQGGDVEANRYLYVQAVFEKYHITEAEFDTSMVWYSGHTEHLEKMYTHIEARLERESNAAGLNLTEAEQYSRYTTEGDTANIWSGRKMLFLHGNREENLYTVVIPTDSMYREGDYFMLHTNNRFIVQENQREGYVLLQITYDNDSVVANTTMVNGNYDVTLNITSDMVRSDARISRISCTFYYAFDEKETDDKFRLWVISNPVLLRYHVLETKTDTVAVVDTLMADSVKKMIPDSSRTERVSPDKFRENQQVDRKIKVIQKRDVVLPQNQQPRRVIKPVRR